MKTTTINGHRYRIEQDKWSTRLVVRGPGLLIGVQLPDGVTLDSLYLRQQVIDAVAESKQRSKEAGEALRKATGLDEAGLRARLNKR